MWLNVEKLAANNGVTWDVVKTARFADINTVSRPKNPQELANIQRIVDRIYDRFITKVANSRKLPKNKVQEIAQGRVWSGTAAKQLGLVDEIGGIEDAVEKRRSKLNSATIGIGRISKTPQFGGANFGKNFRRSCFWHQPPNSTR